MQEGREAIEEGWSEGRGAPEPVHLTGDPPPEREPPGVMVSFDLFIHDPFGS